MVVVLAPGDAPGTLDQNKLFIEPPHIRGSVGPSIVNLSGRDMLVVSVARQLGSGNSFARLIMLPH